MRTLSAAALLAPLVVTVLGGPSALSQAVSDPRTDLPRYNVSLGYNFIRANAPPGSGCDGCFGMNGGYASAAVTLKYWLSVAAEVRGAHGSNIGPLGQGLTLLTYSAGPRVTFRARRVTSFGQVLFGAAHGSDSYFPTATSYTTGATSFALTAGGGFDYHLNHRFDVRALDIEYLRTSLPNGVNNEQNHLLVGAGIVFKFRSHQWTPDPGGERKKADKASRALSQAVRETNREQEAAAAPPQAPLSPAPPTEVVPLLPAPIAPAAAVAVAASYTGVPNALFDGDGDRLRPDAVKAVHTAAVLGAHPGQGVTIGGYADERGSADYNVALSRRRAEAARNALVAPGIAPDRIATVAYGKQVQTCTTEDAACLQQNRRAAFVPR